MPRRPSRTLRARGAASVTRRGFGAAVRRTHSRALRQIVVDRLEVDAYELPFGELGAHDPAGDERVGRDDRRRRGEVSAAQDVGRPDASFGVDEVPAEENEVLVDEGVDEGLVVDLDPAESRALEQ